ncbi:TolC family protein [Synechococcus sp. Minos11]|uniref:TolC family protein n=1 Tax=Synechococcus sp. Minos11 TaxID=221341 RepID=UPI0016459E3B|nr:TolC family protein [Synechococcus sp. Minos11]
MLALVLMGFPLAALAQEQEDTTDWLGNPLWTEQPEDIGVQPDDSVDPFEGRPLPTAIQEKGPRPKSDPSVLAPAATTLSPDVDQLGAPAPLALPNEPSQVRIEDLRPLSLTEAVELMEVNNPFLEAAKIRIDEAQSRLRAAIAAWYPTLNLTTNRLKFPGRNFGTNYRNFGKAATDPQATQRKNQKKQQFPDMELDRYGEWWGTTQTYGASATATLDWKLINPKRVPDISAARDDYEKAQNNYLIALRDLRLQTAREYFQLQAYDTDVYTFTAAVQASLVNVRDTRAKLQAGVATKLDVLEAETQLAQDQAGLSRALRDQSVQQRLLAKTLNLPQNVTPTASDRVEVLGVWQASLDESIIAANEFREELDNIILDISIYNSRANSFLGDVQPFLNIAGDARWSKSFGEQRKRDEWVDMGRVAEDLDQAIYMGLTWKVFDGGRAQALAREQKQKAKESEYLFAEERNKIREQVEQQFFDLQLHARDLISNSRRVLSSREAYRLAVLRFQAGVGTQRNVIDNQRDVTRAEVAYTDTIALYNRTLAALRRQTGLDAVVSCIPAELPGEPPVKDPLTDVPVFSTPITEPCAFQRATFVPPAD